MKNPVSEKVMIVAMDIAEDITAILWNITGFVSVAPAVLEANTEVQNDVQESVMFDWDRYDPNPSVINLTINQSIISVDMTQNFSVNITDNIALNKLLYANITYPNGTIIQYLLSNTTTTIFNGTVPNTTATGNYMVRIIANDTSTHLNFNTTTTVNFTVIVSTDLVYPSIPDYLPALNSIYNISETFFIAVNATDDANISRVFANVSEPNGTVKHYELLKDVTSRYNTTFTTPSLLGIYNITFFANDTGGNENRTVATNFTVHDRINPSISDYLSAQNNYYNISTTIQFALNTTDDYNVSRVFANLSEPNGTIKQYELIKDTDSRYNITFTVPALLGIYNITYFANDTSNNENRTVISNFTVQDRVTPNITDYLPPQNNYYNLSDVIRIAINVTDDDNISRSFVNISEPNNTIKQYELIKDIDNRYNITFTVPALLGIYNLTYFANDTSNNQNRTVTSNFTVHDRFAPSVTISAPLFGSSYTQYANVSIETAVTDEIGISAVLVNVTLPNGSIKNYTLTDHNSDGTYNYTFNETTNLGTYNFTIIANDTSNNVNNTEWRTFSIQDTSTPNVYLRSPSDASVQANSTVVFNCNATEDSQLANLTLYHNISGTFIANQTNIVTGTSNQTNFTLENVADGTVLWNCLASDELKNTAFALSNYTVIVDTTAPSVVLHSPVLNTRFNYSNLIELAVNVTDGNTINQILVNVTYPNSTIYQYSLSFAIDSKYNVSFTAPLIIGGYNLTFIANDSVNNINNSIVSNFTVRDLNAPSLTYLGCRPTNINITQSIVCNVSVSDVIGISRVIANVTFANSTVETQTVSNISNIYYFNFTNSLIAGQFNITWFANDTSNNDNRTEPNFNVSDYSNPSVTLNYPVNQFNSSSTTVSFNYTATDDAHTRLNCSVIINETINNTNSSVVNGTTIINIDRFLNGTYSWNISCNDQSGNLNRSELRTFIVDTSVPYFASLTTTPSSTDDLDPFINITVYANVTDNFTSIQNVTFQYKLSNETDYTNLTMNYDESTFLYNSTFNATKNGTYNMRLWANDTAGNSVFSSTENISVESETTWTRSPSVFTSVSASLNTNVTLGNLTINNTGDSSLSFLIKSNSNETYYNETENFTLTAKQLKSVAIYDNASRLGIETVTFTINATPDGTPAYNTSTATIVVAPGQPLLSSTFLTPSTDTLAVTQGDTGVSFDAKLDNLGEGDAANVTFFFQLPDDWTITYGLQNITAGDFYSGDSIENDLQLTIPDNATTGEYLIVANASGVNTSSADLHDLGFIFADTVKVTVSAPPAALGVFIAPAAVVEETSSLPPAGTAGAAGGGGGSLARVVDVFSVKRGTSGTSQLEINNIYKNTVLTNVRLELNGFMSQYMTWTPEVLTDIPYGESKNFLFTISVPAYLSEAEYELTAKIVADIIPNNPIVSGYSIKPITEYRTIILKVLEVDYEDLSAENLSAEQCIAEMETAGFPILKVKNLFAQANQKIGLQDYKEAKKLLNSVCQNKNDAFKAHDLILELEQNIAEAKENGLILIDTNDDLNIAKLAFEREDFALAVERAKAAQLTYVLESKEQFDILKYIVNNPISVALGSLAILLIVSLSYTQLSLFFISKRILNFNREENTILDLIKELQIQYLQKQELSESQYHRYLNQYEKRISKIKQQRIQLRNQRAFSNYTPQELKNLIQEKEELQQLLQETQKNYFVRGKSSQAKFQREYESAKSRLREVEMEEMVAKKRLRREKNKVKIFTLFSRINNFLTNQINKIIKIK